MLFCSHSQFNPSVFATGYVCATARTVHLLLLYPQAPSPLGKWQIIFYFHCALLVYKSSRVGSFSGVQKDNRTELYCSYPELPEQGHTWCSQKVQPCQKEGLCFGNVTIQPLWDILQQAIMALEYLPNSGRRLVVVQNHPDFYLQFSSWMPLKSTDP